MKNKRQWFASAVIFVALFLLFAATVPEQGPWRNLFYQWTGLGYLGRALSPGDKVRLLVWGCVLAVAFMVYLLSKLETPLVKRTANLWTGSLILLVWCFIPGLASFFQARVGGIVWPSLAPVAGIVFVLAGVRDKWLAWEVGCGLFLLLAWLMMPVWRIFYPDFYFEGHIWTCYMVFALLFVLTAGFYYLVVPVLWSQSALSDYIEGPEVDDVSPDRGRTVMQILREPYSGDRRSLLFGDIDEELVRKWGLIGQAIMTMVRTRQRRILSSVCALLAWPVLFYIVSGGSDGAYDRDVIAMWETGPAADGSIVSTPGAMTAARRVFENESRLLGLTRDEVKQQLRMEMMNPKYPLNKPLYAWQEDQFMLRIGDGKDSYALYLAYGPDRKVSVVWGKKEPYEVRKNKRSASVL